MDLPLGYHTKGENLVCKLKKFIYGLCQTFLQWFHKFTSTIISAGFNQSKFDYSLFYASSRDSYVALLVHVNDIIIDSKDFAASPVFKCLFRISLNSKCWQLEIFFGP